MLKYFRRLICCPNCTNPKIDGFRGFMWFRMSQILEEEIKIMEYLEGLKEEVKRSKEVMDGAIILLKGLHQRLESCGNNEMALGELKKELESETSRLAQAILINTPQEKTKMEPLIVSIEPTTTISERSISNEPQKKDGESSMVDEKKEKNLEPIKPIMEEILNLNPTPKLEGGMGTY